MMYVYVKRTFEFNILDGMKTPRITILSIDEIEDSYIPEPSCESRHRIRETLLKAAKDIQKEVMTHTPKYDWSDVLDRYLYCKKNNDRIIDYAQRLGVSYHAVYEQFQNVSAHLSENIQVRELWEEIRN